MLSSFQRADENEFNPYEILGVGRDFSELELRTKYKQAVRRSHPDRGGTDLEMANVYKANEILTDPRKRKLYDQFGARALQLINRQTFVNSSTFLKLEKKKNRILVFNFQSL